MGNIYANANNPNELMGNHEDLKDFASEAVKSGASQVIVNGEQAVVMADNNETANAMPACVLSEPEKTKIKQVDNQEIDDNSAPVMPPCINAVSNEDSSDAINKAGRTGGGHVDMGQQSIDEKGQRVEESETISQPPSVIG